MVGFANDGVRDAARGNMVVGQLIANGIRDPALLSAMGGVARELFLPERLQGKAYADENIRLDARHILFSPRIEAKLLLLAEPKPTDFVLDAGAFTGYTAAVMAGMTRAVVALESDESVCDGAQQLLIDAQIDNVAVLNLPPEQGFAAQSPFDIVFLDGVVSRIPDALIDQLAENGRLVAVVADTGDTAGKAVKIVKKNAEPFRSTAFEIELGGFLSSNDVKSFDFETLS